MRSDFAEPMDKVVTMGGKGAVDVEVAVVVGSWDRSIADWEL